MAAAASKVPAQPSKPASAKGSRRRASAPAMAELPGAKPERLRDEAFAPELCKVLSEPPRGDDWLHELKWDGYRLVATVLKGAVRLWSRNAIEWTRKVPELAEAIATLGLDSAQLDGEMIVLNEGRDDFNALQGRLSAETREPAVLMLFDMPHVNGLSLREVPLFERKAALKSLLAAHPHPLVKFSEHRVGEGASLFAETVQRGGEGIVSKRVASAYRGTRNGDWVKVKGRPSDEFVVVGYTEPKGSRAGIGALLLAKAVDGRLVYVGRVGTGISAAALAKLRKELEPALIAQTEVDLTLMEKRDRALALWVKPKKVVEVFFQGIGAQGLLRQPAFKAFRDDKPLGDLNNESAPARKTARRVTPATPAKPAPSKAKPTARRGLQKDAPGAKRQTSDLTAADAVVITHHERIVYPDLQATKGEVAVYYREVAGWMLPELADRPLSVVRCPDGAAKGCFFQKHLAQGWGKHILGVDVRTEKEKYLCVREAAGILELVQMGVLEFHPWGARASDVDHADRIVFDLDPHPTVKWSRVVASAEQVRKQLASIGLESFLRTSGNKGFHVVVPLQPPRPWAAVREFAQAFSEVMARMSPKEFVTVSGERNRVGKIFIDYLRNGRGSTSVASFSLRAKPAAGVAMPLAWSELARIPSSDVYTLRNAVAHIRRWKSDPWESIGRVRQTLPTF